MNCCFSLFLGYHYIKMSLWGFFHFLMPVIVQQWCVEIGTFNDRYILRYQNCNFVMKGKTVVVGICFWLLVDFFCNFIFLLYFVDSWKYWGEPRRRIALPAFLFVIWIWIVWLRIITSNFLHYKRTAVFINMM